MRQQRYLKKNTTIISGQLQLNTAVYAGILYNLSTETVSIAKSEVNAELFRPYGPAIFVLRPSAITPRSPWMTKHLSKRDVTPVMWHVCILHRTTAQAADASDNARVIACKALLVTKV